MGLFNFSQEELLTFFAVLVRYSVLIAVLPFVGDKFAPVPVKILFSLLVTIVLFPALVSGGQINPGEAIAWGGSVGGIATTIGLEALFGLVLGFTAKLVFDSILFGANMTGNFMGFAMASTYDPHQEAHTQVIAEIQMALAMLLFLAIDGHHSMIQASLSSYGVVGMGKLGLGAAFSAKLVELTGQVLKFGMQLAAPVAVSLFTVNIMFGIMAKAMPQLNVLVLSFSVSAMVGLAILFFSLPEFQGVTAEILGQMGNWMEAMKAAVRGA